MRRGVKENSKEKNKNTSSIQNRIDERIGRLNKVNLWSIMRLYVDVAFFQRLSSKLIVLIYVIGVICSATGITIFNLYFRFRTLLLWLIILSVFAIILYIIIYPSIRFIKNYILIQKNYKKNNVNCFKLNASLYGLYIKEEELNYILKNNGSSSLKNKLTITPTTEPLYSIEKRCKSLSLGGREVGLSINIISGSRTKISTDLIKDAQSEKIWKIKFVPSIDRYTDFSYIINENMPEKSYAMTKKTLPPYLKYEYVSKQVRYPTELLIMEMVFPKGFIPVDYDFDVWFGEGQLRNRAEHMRIDNDKDRSAYFEDDKNDDGNILIRLYVKYPILGLFYTIHWNPP